MAVVSTSLLVLVWTVVVFSGTHGGDDCNCGGGETVTYVYMYPFPNGYGNYYWNGYQGGGYCGGGYNADGNYNGPSQWVYPPWFWYHPVCGGAIPTAMWPSLWVLLLLTVGVLAVLFTFFTPVAI